jgi:hypothetical protein
MADERRTEVIPLIEEELHLEKRSSATGKVRVRTETEVVEEIARATLDGDLSRSRAFPSGGRSAQRLRCEPRATW